MLLEKDPPSIVPKVRTRMGLQKKHDYGGARWGVGFIIDILLLEQEMDFPFQLALLPCFQNGEIAFGVGWWGGGVVAELLKKTLKPERKKHNP